MSGKQNFGTAFVQSTFKGIVITVTDFEGCVVSCTTPNSLGFRSDELKAISATRKVAEVSAKAAKKRGIETISMRMRGDIPEKEEIEKVFKQYGLSTR